MNAIKILKRKEELKKAIEENCAKFNAVEEAMYEQDISDCIFAEFDKRRSELLEECACLEEQLEIIEQLISSLVIKNAENPNGVTVAEAHYDSKIGCYKPSLGTALIKDENGSLIEVKLRPDNLIRSQWADNFVEGHQYRWKGRPIKKRPFHNVDFEWVCFVTHIEEVTE